MKDFFVVYEDHFLQLTDSYIWKRNKLLLTSVTSSIIHIELVPTNSIICRH